MVQDIGIHILFITKSFYSNTPNWLKVYEMLETFFLRKFNIDARGAGACSSSSEKVRFYWTIFYKEPFIRNLHVEGRKT